MPVVACLVIAIGVMVHQFALPSPPGSGIPLSDFNGQQSEEIAMNNASNPSLVSNDVIGNSQNGQEVDITAAYGSVSVLGYGFVLDGKKIYSQISFQKRKEYGLVSQDAVGLINENIYTIVNADIGVAMGAISHIIPGSKEFPEKKMKTRDGFEFKVLYNPVTKTFCMIDSYYQISDENECQFRERFGVTGTLM
jgi:hypothetical protein